MKKLTLFFLLLPFFVQAQYDYLKLENTQIFFEKVYILDTLKSSNIEKLLLTGVPKLKDVTSLERAQDIITVKIRNTYIDYKKYGGKWGNTPAFLNHPFFGDVSIVWKDGKYKVTVSNMYFNTAGFGIINCSDILTKKNGTEVNIGVAATVAGQYIEKYLADLFLITSSKNEW